MCYGHEPVHFVLSFSYPAPRVRSASAECPVVPVQNTIGLQLVQLSLEWVHHCTPLLFDILNCPRAARYFIGPYNIRGESSYGLRSKSSAEACVLGCCNSTSVGKKRKKNFSKSLPVSNCRCPVCCCVCHFIQRSSV